MSEPEYPEPDLIDRLSSLLDELHAAGVLLDVQIIPWTVGPPVHAEDDDGECPCPDPEEGNWSAECKALNEWQPALTEDDACYGPHLIGQPGLARLRPPS